MALDRVESEAKRGAALLVGSTEMYFHGDNDEVVVVIDQPIEHPICPMKYASPRKRKGRRQQQKIPNINLFGGFWSVSGLYTEKKRERHGLFISSGRRREKVETSVGKPAPFLD